MRIFSKLYCPIVSTIPVNSTSSILELQNAISPITFKVGGNVNLLDRFLHPVNAYSSILSTKFPPVYDFSNEQYSNASLGITKLELISRLPGDVAAEITEDGSAEKMSVREIKALVEENKRLTGQVALFEGELEKVREENDANMMALEEARCELRDRPCQVVEKNLSAEQSEKLRAETKAEVEAEMKKQFAAELKEKVQKTTAKLEKTYTEQIKDAEKALAEKSRLENTIKARDAEAEKYREEVEKLKRELSVASGVGAEIRVYFDAAKDYFLKAINKIEELGEEERERYKAAFRGLLAAIGEIIGEDAPSQSRAATALPEGEPCEEC